jgi:menaquinol-cytochrome c reductase cytochrome b subunit
VSTNGRGVRTRGWYKAIVHPGATFKESEVYGSAIRHPSTSTPRGRAMTSFHNFFLHVYPVKVPAEIVRTRTTLRLGFVAGVLYGVLFVSGMYLMFFYHPAVPDAYFDMHTLSTSVAFGQFVRNAHRWAAHLMVVVVAVHLLRVFYAGAYKAPRQFNWVIGVLLLVLTLLMSFTGYLLPWDQLSFWAITVGTNIAGYVPVFGNQARSLMLGGNEVGGAALLRFYVLHIYLLPASRVVLIAIHIWRVRKDGFAVVDRRREPGGEAGKEGEAADA